LTKVYPELLEIIHLNEQQRTESLRRIFDRDITNNYNFHLSQKRIHPIKSDGEPPLDTLFRHLTTREDKDEEGRSIRSRSFEPVRSQRLHWIKYLIESYHGLNVEVFSYEDRDYKRRKDVIRTYIYDLNENYVIILEPQRNNTNYYLLTAYHLNEPGGKKQIDKKLKKKLVKVY